MKTTTLKTRIIAGVLSAFTVFSVAAFATASASAAEITDINEAEQNGMTVVTIGDEQKGYDNFKEAWDQAVAAKEANVKINAPELCRISDLVVPSGMKLTVDLGGNIIRANDNLFKVEKGAECTIRNGSIEMATNAVTANGDTNLYNLTISYAQDNAVKGGEGAKVVVDGCRFTANGGERGGALYLPYLTEGTVIRNCVFERNKSKNEGAAVYTPNPIYSCTFMENEAATDGGAVYMTGDNADIRNCTFEKNNASSNGGAIAFSQDVNNINDCTFVKNRSGNNGGAVYVPDGKDLNTQGSKFDSNYSCHHGGAIYMGHRSRLDLRDSEITQNTADKKGGGLYLGALVSKHHAFHNVVITGNTSKSFGGGVYADAQGMSSADVDFTGVITVRGNNNNDFFLWNSVLKKAMIFTKENFNSNESYVFVNSSDRKEVGVVDLYDKRDEDAFRGNDNRSLSRGFFFYETLYIGELG